MALADIRPVTARVNWDRRTRRPTEVHGDGHHLRVVDLDGIRDERSAYPADRGPRVTFRFTTDDGRRASLVYDGRRRSWFLEAVEPAA